MPTLTTNFSFNKPNVNSADDEDLWGDQLNDNWDDIDGYLKTARDLVTVTTTSATYSASSSNRKQLILADTTSNAIEVDLPSAATVGNGFEIAVKLIEASNAVTLDPNGAETIDGASTLVMATLDDVVNLVSNGTNWEIKSSRIQATTDLAGIGELATAAEVTAGTAGKLVDAAELKTVTDAIPFSEGSFQSADQTITAGNLLTLAHGLSSTPTLLQGYIECQTAEYGYSTGDQVAISGMQDANTDQGVSIWADATNVYVQYGLDTDVFRVFRRSATAGQAVTITKANWRFFVRAWA